MPVVQPHLQTLVREGLLHHNVRPAVLVYIERPERQRCLIRCEEKLAVLVAGIVKFDSKALPSLKQASIEKNGAVELVIVVEIRCGKMPTAEFVQRPAGSSNKR